ncbi:MAG TPA: glycosyltransferase [Sulfuriferula sp.]|nr:glycosyltransferase [Sulfuriferula sp.]
MKFSLVMATRGRSMEIERPFNSRANQMYKNFEAIVVDRNEDDRQLDSVNVYGDMR